MHLDQSDFPNLHAGNHRIERGAEKRYNCISWAAGFDDIIWDPNDGEDPEVCYYWPPSAPRDYHVTSLMIAFESVGFAVCANGSLEAGFEKIAIYADGPEYMHAACQMENGKWTSKMGKGELIEHDGPEDVAGPCYGQVVVYMQRERSP